MSELVLGFLLIITKDIMTVIRIMAVIIILILPITMVSGVITVAIRVIMASVITEAIMVDITATAASTAGEAPTEGEAVLVEEEDLAAVAVVTARKRPSPMQVKDAPILVAWGLRCSASGNVLQPFEISPGRQTRSFNPILNVIINKRIRGHERTN